MWKKAVVTAAVLKGEAHVNLKKKSIPAKECKYVDCKCKFGCRSKISEEHQRELFTEYRRIESRVEQRAYLASLLQDECVQRRTVCDEDMKVARTVSVKYMLKDEGRNSVRVCQKFFCATFAISHKTTSNCIQKKSPTTGRYQSKHGNAGREPHNKTNERRYRQVTWFLGQIPKVPSHYCRKNSKRLYFEANLNLSSLYKLYSNHLKITDPVSFSVFNRIIKEHDPPLAFYQPKKDQCTLCNNNMKSTPGANPEYDEHRKRKDDIKETKSQDKQAALANPHSMRYVTFDLQAILTLPYCEDSQLYYSRKLSVYNFTIHDSTNTGICNVWDEMNGSKGANEIGTCLLQYFRTLEPSIKIVTLYCDTCGGQNRNQFIVGALLLAVNADDYGNMETIDLKYMESGHSMLECDSMHSTIERGRANRKFYLPSEYALLMEMARRNPKPYLVNRLKYSDFLDLHALGKEVITNRCTDADGHQIKWLKVKWFRFCRDSMEVQFKYNVTDDSFKRFSPTAKFAKRNNQTPIMSLETLRNITPVQAYHEELPISVAKKRDLLCLLKKGVIPKEYQQFYNDVKATKDVRDKAAWVNHEDLVIEEEELLFDYGF